ncbi:MAG: ABC transporter permease subunit [Oscillospiraceae bacterium]|nr:ABC transporter permease subunit [Oscillospiraceae bacterium]
MDYHKPAGFGSNSIRANRKLRGILQNWQLYTFLIPALVWVIMFRYSPMYGVQIAFRDYSAARGIWGSNWVGLRHFIRFFNSYYFFELIRNTAVISLYNLLLTFPLPILVALTINEVKNGPFKKIVQTASYAPYFISTVVMCSIILIFLNPTTGIINRLIMVFGNEAVDFMSKAAWFPTVYVLSNVWQGTGWGSIIYLASLSGVDEQLHEAAMIDGATKLQRIRNINIPHIVPTMIILLILNSGSILSVGHEKVYLLQNALNTDTSEVISTYVYKSGLINAQYSFSSAVGLFNSIINLIVLVIVNTIARKVGEDSLW